MLVVVSVNVPCAACELTVMVWWLVEVLWVLSALYVAVMVCDPEPVALGV